MFSFYLFGDLMIIQLSQFEDFQMKWAFETLQRYRKKFCMFNDDIQVIAWLNIFLSLMEPRTVKQSALGL